MKMKKYIISVICLFSAFITLGSIAYINSLFNKIDRTTELVTRSDLGISEDFKKRPESNRNKVINIALLGIDNQNGDNGRSDTIIILSIDKSQNKIKLTSIMRDSFVTIDGHGKDKINHAYAYGGPQLAIKTLNVNFNLNITKYAAVNFADLSAIIDSLGGIELEITDAEASEIPGLKKGGTYNLNCTQALAYSRIRCLAGGDFERTRRQRILLEELYAKLSSKPITQYAAIADELFPAIKTNMTNSEILTLSKYIVTWNPQLEHTRFPTDSASTGKYIDGIYYLVFQEKETVEEMHKFIFGPSS